ncbi:17612_t:CDS:2 [Dentiscutata erythropus]|uniref:17612_t:CDS:1 n=1 Tax=Dentiscutata erythropus TaxID=1348616 RepID=A0A9N9CCM9_9GLOM|nr:17612_t:CDS:2 [Dentiscutata erythropus]
MTDLPNVNDEFLTLEALEEAAQAASKAQDKALPFQDEIVIWEGNNGRSPTLSCSVQKAEIGETIELSIVWIITKTEYVHNHPLLQADEIVSLPQHRNLSVIRESSYMNYQSD